MIKSIKVQLLPNNKQNTKLFQCSGVARWGYNWALAKQKESYKLGGKFLNDGVLRKELTQLKKEEKYKWLNDYSNNITKQSIKDACEAYKSFFKKKSGFPKFKNKKKSMPSFYQDNFKIEFTNTHVKIEKLTKNTKGNKRKFNLVKLAEKNRVPIDCKYFNPRITYDGLHWWISVGVEYDYINKININEGIGIDVGIKDLAICSDGNIYKNINKSCKVKKIKKKRHRLQCQISKKYIKNKKGGSYYKTSNIIKSEKQFKKVSQRLANINHNYMHQIISEIINRKPMFITIEDLNIKGMMRNKHLAKSIQEQRLYQFRRQIKYKSEWNNIIFILVDRFYPSSKTCSDCGYIKKDLNLSDREWICPECGVIHDRDYNASVNLKNYGKSVINM